jgi:hypothetical protein
MIQGILASLLEGANRLRIGTISQVCAVEDPAVGLSLLGSLLGIGGDLLTLGCIRFGESARLPAITR